MKRLLIVLTILGLTSLLVTSCNGINSTDKEPTNPNISSRQLEALGEAIKEEERQLDLEQKGIKEINYQNWLIRLNSSRWSGSTVRVGIKITNTSNHRDNFGNANLMDPGPNLVVVDSTNKVVSPQTRDPNFKRGELIIFPSYTGEYYPEESKEVELIFPMHPLSGNCRLCIDVGLSQKPALFDLGKPK